MNVLVIYAHPNEESFCSAIKKTLIEGLKTNRNTIKIHDLYAKKFNPVLSKEELTNYPEELLEDEKIARYQQDIKWANVIVIIHPAWWYGAPAILKGYFDRILTEGFAFTYENDEPDPKLLGKKGILIQTFDATEEMEQTLFEDITYRNVYYTWKYCGVEDWQRKAFYRVNFVNQEQRTNWLDEISVIGKNLN